MAESELAQKITKLVKAADRLVRDIRKNTNEMLKAAEGLRELGKKKDEDDKGKG